MLFIALILLVLSVAYYLLKSNYDYWKIRGVPGPKPTFIIGSLGQAFKMKRGLGEIVTDIYNEFPNASIVGMFRATSPTLIIRDPDLIRNIVAKDFASFHDNDFNVSKEKDPLFGRSPFVLKGEMWKIVRTQLTPGFTSGKMKTIYPLLEVSSKRLVKFIEDEPDALNGTGLEGKELCTKFTLNNVVSCAFGLESRVFEDPNAEFRDIARKFLTPSGLANFFITILFLFPFLTKFFSIKVTPAEVEKRLIDIISDTLKYREENNIQRNDFLQFIAQLRHSSKEYEFTNIDVAAHAAGFFIDGYETSSIVMSFLLYELAANQEKQNKLREALQKKFTSDGNISYEDLQSDEYLDAVFNESLRLHPPLTLLVKVCTKSYTYNPKLDDIVKKPVVIEKGTAVSIPTLALHTDPKYFKDPHNFIPERFLNENKNELPKYVYMPFGEGPRACLGQRFGILQVKAGVAYIINNFELSVNNKTQ